jgi:hypothetical protein
MRRLVAILMLLPLTAFGQTSIDPSILSALRKVVWLGVVPAAKGKNPRKPITMSWPNRFLGFIVLSVVTLFAMAQVNAETTEPLPSIIDPEWVKAEVARHGPEDVVQRLWEANRYSEIIDPIAQGKSRWIAIVPVIGGGTDAGAAEELSDAMASALPQNPNAVLNAVRLTPGNPDVSQICVPPFVEGTKDQYLIYIRRSITALHRVTAPKLAKLKEDCIHSLIAAQGRVDN